MKDRRWSGARKSDSQARHQAAEELAIAALSFIAAETERLGRFLALTGIGPESIGCRARAEFPPWCARSRGERGILAGRLRGA